MKNNYQIGDWVYNGKESQSPVQIVSVYGDRDICHCDIDIRGNDGIVYECDIDMVVPIPLSEKLLQQLGFLKREKGGFYFWNNIDVNPTIGPGMGVRVEYREDLKYWVVAAFKDHPHAVTTENYIEDILYLHELQQAMRLVRINKEVKL